MTREKAAEINGYLDKNGITISALGYYPNPLDADLDQRAVYIGHIRKCIKAAEPLDLKNFNTFIGKDPLKPITENMQEFKRVWPDIIKYAEDCGLKVGIENCLMYFKDEWPGGKNLA